MCSASAVLSAGKGSAITVGGTFYLMASWVTGIYDYRDKSTRSFSRKITSVLIYHPQGVCLSCS